MYQPQNRAWEKLSLYFPFPALKTVTALLLLLLAGCSTIPTTGPVYLQSPGALAETYYDVNIPTHDGKLLRATIFQPKLKAGESAPVILHAHGFGVFRMSAPISIYGTLIYAGKAAKEAWRQGYWVISYDERGHGGSEDIIRVMHPEHEVKDVSTIIDWAQHNLHRVKRDSNNDPFIGIIGESYGGGAALMGSAADSRIDAIVPVTTWHDFQNGLAPNQVPKSGWLTTLIIAGNTLNPGNMDPLLNEAYWQARDGIVGKEIFEYLSPHTTNHNCKQGLYPNADTFFVQGFRDVLFPVNEGILNRECLLKAGKDIRFVGTQGGHLLPFTQWSLIPGYTVEDEVYCGDQKLNMIQAAVSWFDEKLKGIPGAADAIPNMCLTQGYDKGIVVDNIQRGGEAFDFTGLGISSGFAGLFESPLYLFDQIAGLMMPRMKNPNLEDHSNLSGVGRPAFYPLKTFNKATGMTGIPTLKINIDAEDDEEPIVFIGIAVKRASSRHIELINQQITPLRGKGRHTVDMMAISTELEPGDIVGIYAASYNNQYRFSGPGWFSGASLSGEIEVPFLPPTLSPQTGADLADR